MNSITLTIARRSGRELILAALVGVAIPASILTAASATAQPSPARSDGRTWWEEKRRTYPQCNPFTNQHEALSDELDRLAEKARFQVEPQRSTTLRQINATAATRSRAQDDLFGCIRASGGSPAPAAENGSARRPPLAGRVEETNRPQQPPAGGPLQGGTSSYPSPQMGGPLGGGASGGSPQPWSGRNTLPGFKRFSAEEIQVDIRDYVGHLNRREYPTTVDLTDARNDTRKAFIQARGVVNTSTKTFTVRSVVDRGGITHPVTPVTIQLR
jgi:hypothetical protein